MSIWPKSEGLETIPELHLRWKNLVVIALVILIPLFISLFFDSLIVKIICWVIFLLFYMSELQVYGPCITALAVGALPLYICFEWESSPIWLEYIAIIISLIEISYIRHRMRYIKEVREKEGFQHFNKK